MGIADRHYSRPPTGMRFGPAGPARKGLSVTAWLIIACVAIFVVDGFLRQYSSWVETGTYYVFQEDGSWTIEHGSPMYATADRPRETTLGSKVIQLTIPLRQANGKIKESTVAGLPVLGPEGCPVALAVVTPMTPLQRWMHFSTKRVIGGAELWRLVGFQFLHADLNHLMFNMIGLFFFGPLIERFLGGKRYLAFYLLCGIFGALFYLVLNFVGWLWIDKLGLPEIPGLLFNATGVPLIGASAGVFGVIVGGAILQPRATVLLFFIIPMRLATMAVGLIALSLLFILIGNDNAGGEAAHLGGALAGWYFIRRPERLHELFNLFGRVDPTSKHFAMKGGGKGSAKSGPGRPPAGATRVDRILDKISRDGLQSLTRKEKQILEEASRRDRLG